MTGVGLDEIRAAHARIAPHVHRTPVMTCSALDARAGAQVYLKCEHLQRTGAFKARGALNAVLSLPEDAARTGVATHSSGNHAAALSMAAGVRGLRAFIVMPRTAAVVKQAAVRGYGGEIEFCEPTLAAREAGLTALVERTGANVVHPYDDWRVIAGQGTAAVELLEQCPGVDMVMTPVGGGGLLAGTALAVSGLEPGVEMVGVEPAGADDAARGLATGRRVTGSAPDTIADGLRAELGVRNFETIGRLVSRIVTVSDEAIVEAMRFTWERTKQLIEPSAATVIAALLTGDESFRGRRIGVILSGGNCDLENLPWRRT